jgi:hypothetical protein
MGKPPVWKPFLGGYHGLDRSDQESRSGGGGFVGVYRDLLPSIVGMGASGEAYLGGYDGVSGLNGGGRALVELRGLFLKLGVDYDIQREDTSFVLSTPADPAVVAAMRDVRAASRGIAAGVPEAGIPRKK